MTSTSNRLCNGLIINNPPFHKLFNILQYKFVCHEECECLGEAEEEPWHPPVFSFEPCVEDEEIEEEPIQLRGETKICPVCKAEVDGDALFCNHCGAQL